MYSLPLLAKFALTLWLTGGFSGCVFGPFLCQLLEESSSVEVWVYSMPPFLYCILHSTSIRLICRLQSVYRLLWESKLGVIKFGLVGWQGVSLLLSAIVSHCHMFGNHWWVLDTRLTSTCNATIWLSGLRWTAIGQGSWVTWVVASSSKWILLLFLHASFDSR